MPITAPGPPFSHKSGGHTLFLGNDEPPFPQEIHLEANGLIFFIGKFRVIPVGKSQIVKRLVVGVYPFEYHTFAHIRAPYLMMFFL